ncbi:hypothetical protein V8G54_023725 [Vigna mungo]|uniref:DEAD-box ATP-dependent RNA helicase 22 n=1 Tax=Vigna mungo TaxID=3915 RepID=A0AAQ3RPH0_VIGMU
MLHLQNPPIRNQFFSHFLKPTFPSIFKPRPFSLTNPRPTHAIPFVNDVASPSSSQASNGRDTFFAEENVSWTSLGLSDIISRALSDIGLNRPSLVQASSVPSVMSGKDVVIAAETGSGKTYSYLVPLIDKLRDAHEHSLHAMSDQEVTSTQKVLPILCPNVQLCEQVVKMASSLRRDDDEAIVSVAAICGRQGWPIREPDVIVTTPAALLNYVDLDRTRRMQFMRGVKYVVFDEADMLLCGSFQNKVIRLINLLRFDEKVFSRSKKSVAEFSTKDESSLSSEVAFEGEEELQTEATLEEDDTDKEDDINNEDTSVKQRDWRRVRKTYERSKQYVFVAATLPVNGKKTAGGILKHMFPDAEWICGNYLHRHNPRKMIKCLNDDSELELRKLECMRTKYYEMDFYADVRESEIDFNVFDHVHHVPLQVADFTPCFDHSHITNATFTIDTIHIPASNAHDDRYAVFDDVKVDMADFENACTDLGLELELEFAKFLNSVELGNEKLTGCTCLGGGCEICEEISSAICSAANCFAGAKEEYIMCKLDGNDSGEATDSAENTANINSIVHHLKEVVDTETALVKARDGVSAVQGTWNTQNQQQLNGES